MRKITLVYLCHEFTHWTDFRVLFASKSIHHGVMCLIHTSYYDMLRWFSESPLVLKARENIHQKQYYCFIFLYLLFYVFGHPKLIVFNFLRRLPACAVGTERPSVVPQRQRPIVRLPGQRHEVKRAVRPRPQGANPLPKKM